MDELYQKIIAETYTVTDFRRRLRVLKEYISSILYSSDADAYLKNSEIDRDWLLSLGKQFPEEFNRENYQNIFAYLESQANQIVPLTIYISFQMPDAEKLRMGKWIRDNYGPNFFFDLKIDPYLIASCALVWKGIYKDYSIRKKIEDRKEEIISSLKSFI